MNFHVLSGRQTFPTVKDCLDGWQYCWEDLSGERHLKQETNKEPDKKVCDDRGREKSF